MSEEETPYYTTDEVKTHNTKSDLWVILDNKVYDLTDYVAKHPGGRDALLKVGVTHQRYERNSKEASNYAGRKP